jgi:hypothetical protein
MLLIDLITNRVRNCWIYNQLMKEDHVLYPIVSHIEINVTIQII